MDAGHRVHLIIAAYPTRKKLAATVCGCGPQCGGPRLPPYVETVSAPPDASLAEPVILDVPLEEDVTFTAAQVCPPRP